jgi:hypothetical protein
MPGKILISTAYLPSIDYMRVISHADEVLIEKKENYIKQTYRNRCYIVSSHGAQLLSVPIYEGSRHKVPVTEARIDYSKRWQQVHLRAMISSYKSSPYFDFYFDEVEKIVSENFEFLFDLNNALFNCVLNMLRMKKTILYTEHFEPIVDKYESSDYRYRILPGQSIFSSKQYSQVFYPETGFVPGLSIVDLIFNLGPEAVSYLES